MLILWTGGLQSLSRSSSVRRLVSGTKRNIITSAVTFNALLGLSEYSDGEEFMKAE